MKRLNGYERLLGYKMTLNGAVRIRNKVLIIVFLTGLPCIGEVIFAGPPVLGGGVPAPLLPADNWWNLDVSSAPVDPGSSSFISFIGAAKGLHPDFGAAESPGSVATYGFPYIVVEGSQPRQTVLFEYGDESDGVDHTTGQSIPFYPIPDEAKTEPHWIEGGQPGNVDLRSQADRHILILDSDNCYLYELWNTWFDGAQWRAGSGAFFDLKTNNRRPEGWTSADAAGLAILPGLVRYDEVYGSGEIGHAFRATLRATNGYVYPASHRAGSNPLALPLGARLRLKAGVDLSRFQPATQKIFRAMKKYGLIIADNGSDMYVSGTYDPRWVNGSFNSDFRSVTAGDFEVIKLGYQGPQVTYFPHLAIGGGYTTAISLTNTGTTGSSGDLIVTDSSGKPLEVALSAPEGRGRSEASQARTASASIPINMPAGATSVLTLSAPDEASPTVSGWARLVTAGGAPAGVATFQWVDAGHLATIAGVFGSAPAGTVTIPVDNDDSRRRYTGFAIANPNDVEINISLTILEADGSRRSEVRPPGLNPLAAFGQAAAFLHQYADSTLTFRGSVRIAADNGRQFVAVALQQAQGLYTAIPVIPH
jgi:hypothetical protein